MLARVAFALVGVEERLVCAEGFADALPVEVLLNQNSSSPGQELKQFCDPDGPLHMALVYRTAGS